MQIPYTEVAPSIYRPLVPVFVWGPSGSRLIDGLLDPGADVTLLPASWAVKLGVEVAQVATEKVIKTATGQKVRCKVTSLILEVRRESTSVCWRAEVAFADSISKPHWGFRGFLEFFLASFDGPGRMVSLIPGDNLPATTSPTPP